MRVVPDHVVEVTLYGEWDTGHQARQVFHYKNLGAVAADINPADWDAWIDRLYGVARQMMVDNFAWYQVHAVDLTVYGYETYVFPTPYTGSSIGQCLPYQCAALATGYTNTKRCVGKKYLPAIAEEQQADSFLDPSGLARLQDFAAEWIEDFDTGLLTELKSGVWRRSTGTFHRFTSSVARSAVSSQRRRKPGIGI